MNPSHQILHCSGPDDVLLPRILSYLSWDELVLCIRLVNHSWKQAVTFTPVDSFPSTNNHGDILLQQLSILSEQARLSKLICTFPRLQTLKTHGKIIISQDSSLWLIVHGCKELKSLDIQGHEEKEQNEPHTYLPETMEALVSLASLVELNIARNPNVRLDLQQLSKLTQLEILHANSCCNLYGNLSHFQILSQLQVCDLQDCAMVTGHVRDLATHCPKLLYLGLRGTSVQGTLTSLQHGDYPSLIYLDWIHGGSPMELLQQDEGNTIRNVFLGSDLSSVSSAPLAVQRVFDLAKILPSLRLDLCSFHLSKESPDYYSKPRRSSHGLWGRNPPFQVELIQIQNRRGWRWTNGTPKGVCEIFWLDDLAPNCNLMELQLLTKEESIYQGWVLPPTEEEHNDLMYKKLIEKRRRARRQQRQEEEEEG